VKRIFAIGDIHGAYLALVQCLERSGFDFKNDILIVLGDIVDGWSGTYQCVELLLKVKNLICIQGNHDDWFLTYLNTGLHPVNWMQGGRGTAESYLREISKAHMIESTRYMGYITALNPGDVPQTHIDFFKKQIGYYELMTEKEYYCFVHGGFDKDYAIEYQSPMILMWDRNLWDQAIAFDSKKLDNVNGFTKIFIGHTRTTGWRNPECKPLYAGGVWNLDTGAGWSGKLTIMNIETEEYWQSDVVQTLYPDETGRRR
jgi:serine/threonine protein phosphatase 1